MNKCILCGKPNSDRVPVSIGEGARSKTMLLPVCDPCVTRPYFPPLQFPKEYQPS